MNNDLIIKKKIEHLELDKAEKTKHLKHLGVLLIASFVLTFLLYLAFSLALYVGDVFNLQSMITSFMNGGYGLIFFSVIAILLAYVLAGVKHAAYIHFSLFSTVRTILFLLIFTGIMAEVFNSSGVQDSKARTINNNNAEYNALVSSGSSSEIKIDEGLISRIAYAEKILARCKVNVKAGKEKHCNGDKAKLNALKDSQTVLMNAQVSASNSNQSDKFKRLDEIKNESYNPVIRSLSDLFKITMASAVSLLMLTFAVLFEALHYYLSVMRKDTIQAIEGIQSALDRSEIDYLNESEIKERINSSAVSDYPEENKNRWNQGNNVTAQRQSFIGFTNPDTRVSHNTPRATVQPSSTAYSTRITPDTDTRNTVDTVSHYDDLKALIINQDLSVTYRPIKAWMKTNNIGNSDRNRQDLTVEYLDKMFDEGVLKLNPANNGTSINKAKYVLNK